MMGFEIKFKGQILFLPSEAVITVTERNGKDLSIHVGAYNPVSQDSMVWLQSKLLLSDEIHIKIQEIENTTEPVEIFNFFERMNTSKEDSDKKAFERYHLLREELLDEGLISE